MRGTREAGCRAAKGDYTEWETNYTPEISDRNLTRLARLLEMAPAAHRDRLLAGVKRDSTRALPRTDAERLALAMLGKPDQPRPPLSRTNEAGMRT